MLYEIMPTTSPLNLMDEEENLSEPTVQNGLYIVREGNTLTVKNTVSETVNWAIYNIYGQQVLSGQSTTIDLSALAAGSYTVVAYDDESVAQTKIVK